MYINLKEMTYFTKVQVFENASDRVVKTRMPSLIQYFLVNKTSESTQNDTSRICIEYVVGKVG